MSQVNNSDAAKVYVADRRDIWLYDRGGIYFICYRGPVAWIFNTMRPPERCVFQPMRGQLRTEVVVPPNRAWDFLRRKGWTVDVSRIEPICDLPLKQIAGEPELRRALQLGGLHAHFEAIRFVVACAVADRHETVAVKDLTNAGALIAAALNRLEQSRAPKTRGDSSCPPLNA